MAAEAFLSASVQLLLDKIVYPEFVSFLRSIKLDDSLLEKLRLSLLSLQAVLNDAEEKQITNSAVKDWLVQLRDAVFDAEDLLDEINTEALRRRVKAEYTSQSVRGKLQNILSSPFKWSCRKINHKMQILLEKLQNIEAKIQYLGLTVGVSSNVWHGTPTASVLVDESAIYGRDEDRKILKNHLLSDVASDNGSKIGVVSIVGMGGLGKTTLAQLLYNDPEVTKKFDLKAWTHISKNFDVCKVTQNMLESLTSITDDSNYITSRLGSATLKTIGTTSNQNPPNQDSVTSAITNTSNLNTLLVQLQQCLSNKKFLLVLDDIWEGSYVVWNTLKDIFNAGETGSMIIITTRDQSVALAMQTFLPIHKLEGLEDEDCWSLFAKHAFGPSSSEIRSNLEVIGRKIAEKCGGLPLAAVALGGLLRSNPSQQYWEKVLKSNIWDLQNVEVQPALLLSYHYLPSSLKQCFAYCSIFPKNSKLEKKRVVQLWIAQGLVRAAAEQESMEQTGDGYFNELVSRSLILRRSVGDDVYFEMHDLINDLATMVSSPYCIRIDEQKNMHASVRHLSYNREEFVDTYHKFEALRASKGGLRTFLRLPLNQRYTCGLSKKVLNDLLQPGIHLRALSLSGNWNVKLLDSVGNFIYLRYLDLSYTRIERLPSATGKLHNLETLLLFGCLSLAELPKDMGKLVNLRHLDISDTPLRELPIQIGMLQNLQSLSNFIVSQHDNGLKVAELSKFPHLQGKLSISGLENVTRQMDASGANLKMKEQIDELELIWDYRSTTDKSKSDKSVLEQLEPSTNLEKLSILSYGGIEFPNWVGDSSFGNMVYLKIWCCARCSSLPPLGQLPKLKELVIGGMKSVKTIGVEFYGSDYPLSQPFPSLEILRFEEMPEWVEWILSRDTAVEFPRLRHLSLIDCPKLNRNLSIQNDIESHCGTHVLNLYFNSLRELVIQNVCSLTSFPRDGLPRTLQSLSLISCRNLEFLPCESLHSYKSLESLTIERSCNSMKSFTLGSLPVLKRLSLNSCGLESILVAEDASQSLSLLRSIDISSCNELLSFSPSASHFPNLIHFQVIYCPKLKSLPEDFNTLACLQKLTIIGLPYFQSFAKEGLPTNLRELYIENIRGVSWSTAVTEWRLERLVCLSVLAMSGGLVKTLMEMEEPLLPTSLTSLYLSLLYDIECLDGRWLQHLTSLQNLRIIFCRKLKSLPEEGLPSSLKVLQISICHKSLGVSLKKKKGKEWHKIAHIPTIYIEGELVE